MLRFYPKDKTTVGDALWIDMLQPTKEEEHEIERTLGLEVPTPEEVREVESSSQIYTEGDAIVMNVRVIAASSSRTPTLVNVTFILTPTRLVTLRYSELQAFNHCEDRLRQEPSSLTSPKATMIAILEAIVDRAADILEGVGDRMDAISNQLFADKPDLGSILPEIGRGGNLASRVRESLHSIFRVTAALRRKESNDSQAGIKGRLNTLRRDVKSLLDHDSYVTSKIQFLLDSALGLISIQQNAIIKIFSVAAVIFLPPTLVASLYGMNFQHMPELKWMFGYPYALCLMVLSAVLPYWYFKRRHWL